VKIAILLALTALGLWYNTKATRHWWAVQKRNLPPASDVLGWVGVSFSGIWYLFVYVFVVGLTLNNTLFR
jgi:hypothetical protein